MGILRIRVPIIFLLFLSSTTCGQSQNLFIQPPTYPGFGPLVTADFNRDGKPDLISADGNVMLGNGDGTFRIGTPLTFPPAGNVNLIIAGDFNGDGNPDLLISEFNSTNLYTFLGNGDGTFKPAVITNIGATLSRGFPVDVNGDRKLDVIGIAGSLIFVLTGNGDGTFTLGATYPQMGTAFAVGDFNGDGKTDILVAAGTASGHATGSVGVLLGNGDGTFQPQVTSTGINNATSIAVADFNRDGKLDIVLSDQASIGGETTYVLLGNGNGTFQAPGSPLSVTGNLATADLNGDGKPDLMIGTDAFLEIFLGNGDGTFTLKDTYLTFPGESVTADFNGDGKLDIAAGHDILIGNGDGSFKDNPASVVGNFQLGPIIAGDFNKDGTPDIAVLAYRANSLVILLGDGTGKFSVTHTYTLPFPGDAIATADLNGDGKLDLVFTSRDSLGNWTLNVMLGNGDSSFGTPTAFSQSGISGVINIAVTDFNGDGKPDLACIVGDEVLVFLGNGDGTFASPKNFFAGSGPNSFVTADLNRDGKTDIAVASSAGLGLLLGKGDGTFLPATFPNASITGLFSVADFNGDGAPDLLAIYHTSTNSTGEAVFLGNGDGTFQAPLPLPLSQFLGIASVVDVSGDGKLDLLTSPSLEVLLGNGDGTFGGPIFVLSGFANGTGLSRGVVLAADFNRDGRPDVLLAAASATMSGVATVLNTTQPPTADFLINASLLSPAVVSPGSSASSTLTLTPIGGFTAGVTLSCSGLPSGSNCSFAPSSLPSGMSMSTLTITTTTSTPVGTYPVFITGTSSAITHDRIITLTIANATGATTASLAPQVLTFPQQASGTTSSALRTTLANIGAAQLNVSVISVTGTNSADFVQSNNCGSALAAGATCEISVMFTPAGVGLRSAAISVNDNATGSPQMVALTGMGPDFSLAPSGATSATVTAGQTANYMISVAPGGGFAQSVTLTCSGAPAQSICTVSPTSLALNGSPASATVTVTTAAPSKTFALPFATGLPRSTNYRSTSIALGLLGMLMVVSWFLWRDPRLRCGPMVTLAVLLLLGTSMTSCGGGSGGGSGRGSPGTQAGTYTLTISGTFTSGATTLTHTTKLTLVVTQ